MTEGQLQDAIRLELGKSPYGVWWRNNCGFDAERKIRYGVGNPGGADLIGLYFGIFVAVEIKTERGRLTPEQKMWGELVEKKGGIYAVVRSVEDARALLTRLAD